VIGGSVLLFKDVEVGLGLLIAAWGCTLCFGEVAALGCQQLQIV